MIAEKLMADPNYSFKEGVFYQSQFTQGDFESAYIDIRNKEGRLLSDSGVLNLPTVERDHQHFKEWQIRSQSATRLAEYLKKRQGDKNILEVGCGNGWLCHNLSKITNAQVIGLDVNVTELRQAARVFGRLPNINFIAADVLTLRLPVKINYIVLASAIQYFPDIVRLVEALTGLLPTTGEIHILDSPFYDKERVGQAKERSHSYFKSQHSQMQGHYHHHTCDELSKFKYEVLYNPSDLITKLKNKLTADSPFPWIKINK